MLEPRKRTALDGAVWWCVFDTKTMAWNTLTCFGKYKLKRDCQFAIDHYLHCKHVREDGICLKGASSTGRCMEHCSYFER